MKGQSEIWLSLMKRMEIIMSYVITNGEYYIKYLHRAQITKDIEESYKFETIDLAKEILQAASNVLKDYYVYNLKTQRKCWRIMTEEELEELRARKKIKRTKSGKIKRKTYSPDVKKLLYIKADGKCELCGKKILLDDMTIDHVKPLSMGGEDDVSNLSCTCLPCNVFKGNILPENFLNRINDIFMYQTEKNTKHKLKWKIVHRLLLSCIK
jgi:5-methylcytosine-specific restriction endonuclease McrA